MTKSTPLRPVATPTRWTGSCHCGAVRFEVRVEPGFRATRCNCSICMRTAATGLLVEPPAFRLLTDASELSGYQWGGNVSTRYFCKHCGIHCYGAGHLPEIGGDFVSVNLNCVIDVDPNQLEIVHWDGRHDNWMAGPRSTPWPVTENEPAGNGRSASAA